MLAQTHKKILTKAPYPQLQYKIVELFLTMESNYQLRIITIGKIFMSREVKCCLKNH